MTDALFGTPAGAVEDCDCDQDCEQLRKDTELLRTRLENHLKSHQREEQEEMVWTWKCAKPGCIRTVTNVGPIRAGQTLRCPIHGTGPLEQIFPPLPSTKETPVLEEPVGAVVALERPNTGRRMPEPGAVRHRI